MTLSEKVVKDIIKKLIKNQDYRIEIVTLINAEFLQYVVEFFEKVVEAKLKNKNISIDWYKNEFMNENLPSKDIAINSGLNIKTIKNMYNTAKKEIVISASNDHYDNLYKAIKELVDEEQDLDITLTIRFKGVGVDLNINESLIVINTLAVKRAALRGGLWSTAGKRVEKPLMLTLCKLFHVSEENYSVTYKGKDKRIKKSKFEREIDFYLLSNGTTHKCEVKLMGIGNPESADAVIARDSKVFVADKLSNTNKAQLDSLGVEWVELRNKNGFMRFKKVLNNLDVPHENFKGELDNRLNEIFKVIF